MVRGVEHSDRNFLQWMIDWYPKVLLMDDSKVKLSKLDNYSNILKLHQFLPEQKYFSKHFGSEISWKGL